jgi:thiol-disulfide isomerase/thioredoxin
VRKISIRLLFVLFVFGLPFACMSAEITLTGKIAGHDDKPPVFAAFRYTVLNEDGDQRIDVQVDSEGRFAVKIPDDKIGSLYVIASDHHWLTSTIIPEIGGKPIDMNIRLAPQGIFEKPDAVKIVGSWDKFDYDASKPKEFIDNWAKLKIREAAELMTKRDDGTFVYEKQVKPGIYGYQLLNATRDGEKANGTQSDQYLCDSSMNIISLVKVTGGKLTIVFDPSKAPHNPKLDPPAVQFDSENARQQTLWEIENSMNQTIQSFMADMFAQAETSVKESATPAKFDWSELIGSLQKRMNEGSDPAVRQYAGLSYAHVATCRGPTVNAPFDEIAASSMFELIPPDSRVWAIAPDLPEIIVKKLSWDKVRPLLQGLIDKNENRIVQGFALAALTKECKVAGDTVAFEDYYGRLAKEYAQFQDLQDSIYELSPDRKLLAGKTIPAFEVELLDEKSKVSDATLKGQYYLIDFWATWCKPCVGEMPELHKAFERFKSANFTILSFSFDRKIEDIAPFRSSKWKMPWKHAFVQGAFDSELARSFEVKYIPQPILVGPDGKILAVGDDLRGEDLIPTLQKFLPPAKKE